MAQDWEQIAQRDRELRAQVDESSGALQELRYVNTLGAKPKVTYASYARECCVTEAAVRVYARAYEIRMTHTDYSPAEALVAAGMTHSRHEVVEALAQARGVSQATAARKYAGEITEILSKATALADTNKSPLRAEISRLVAVADEPAPEAPKPAARAKGEPYSEFQMHMSKAMRELRESMAVEVELDSEQMRSLEAMLASVTEMIAAITAKLVRLSDSEA